MDYLVVDPSFNSLSLQDLLAARDQFHAHLMHKPNVVGTAVGRYLIRNSDPVPVPGVPTVRPPGPKTERTLENSAVRDYSWPCILVFVSRWVDDQAAVPAARTRLPSRCRPRANRPQPFLQGAKR